MTKVISTIGPESEGSKTEFFVNNSDVIRLNLSHNDIFWHEKNIKLIKKINSKRLILVDLPGIKPRTSNEINLQIKKGQKVQFSNNKKFKNKNLIYISNPLPKIKKNKFFYISDGSFQFKNLGIDKNILTGVSMQNFILTKKKRT